MTSPLSGSLARQIGKAAAPFFLSATLTRDVPGVGGTPFDPSTPTQATYTCKAIVETYNERVRLSGLIGEADRKVLILATSLSVRPLINDRVTVRSVTFTVMEVMSDPAEAVWECRGQM